MFRIFCSVMAIGVFNLKIIYEIYYHTASDCPLGRTDISCTKPSDCAHGRLPTRVGYCETTGASFYVHIVAAREDSTSRRA